MDKAKSEKSLRSLGSAVAAAAPLHDVDKSVPRRIGGAGPGGRIGGGGGGTSKNYANYAYYAGS